MITSRPTTLNAHAHAAHNLNLAIAAVRTMLADPHPLVITANRATFDARLADARYMRLVGKLTGSRLS